MRLKPKSTVKNPRALVYKRFTAIESSESLAIVYETDSDELFWTFDNKKLAFEEIDAENVAACKLYEKAGFELEEFGENTIKLINELDGEE